MRRRDFLASLLSAPVDARSWRRSSQRKSAKHLGPRELKRFLGFAPGPSRRSCLTSFKNPASGFEWAVSDYCDFAFASLDIQAEGLSPHSGFRFAGQQSRMHEKGAKELRLDFLHQKQALKLSLFYTSFPGTRVSSNVASWRISGKRTFPEVSRFDSAFFTVRGPTRDLQVHSVRRSQYALQRLPIGENLELRGGGWNAAEHAGFIAIENVAAREFLFLGIEWERDWGIRFRSMRWEFRSARVSSISSMTLCREVLWNPLESHSTGK